MSINEKQIKKLTPKELLFCNAYLLNFNGSKAAIKAGYSKKTAAEAAYENLRKPHISKYIKERTEELLTQAGINQLTVMKELARIALFNPKKAYNKDGSLKSIPEMDNSTAAVIASFEADVIDVTTGDETRTTTITKKVKFVSKEAALNSLMKYLGLATEKVDVTTKGKPLNTETVIKAVLNL